MRDASRSERGIIIRGPQRLFDSRLALMSGLFADHHGKFREYAQLVWEKFFQRELDIEKFEQLAPLLESVGLSADDFKRYCRNRWSSRSGRGDTPRASMIRFSACRL